MPAQLTVEEIEAEVQSLRKKVFSVLDRLEQMEVPAYIGKVENPATLREDILWNLRTLEQADIEG